MGAPTILPRVHSKQDLEIFNILKSPVWVFDIERKSMWWANKPALVMWSAETHEELLDRNFASDMSEATETRLLECLARIKRGEEHVTDQVCMSMICDGGDVT
jgi:hypothetical protein